MCSVSIVFFRREFTLHLHRDHSTFHYMINTKIRDKLQSCDEIRTATRRRISESRSPECCYSCS